MRENYYILLELDISVKDEAAINTAISKKQSEWSLERNHPTKGTIAQQNLSKIPDIRNVLLNRELREKEILEAKQIIAAEGKENENKLISTGSILVYNGEITESDLKALLSKSQFKQFTEKQALALLKAKIKKEENTIKDDGIQLLEESVMKQIRTNLNLIRKKDLFDFLDLPPSAPCSALIKKADDIYNTSSRNANKTAEVTATNALSVICKTYLKDNDVKQKYIKSLEYEMLFEVNELIDLAANDMIINNSEFEKLILECTKKGISADKAKLYIMNYSRKKSIALITTDKAEPAKPAKPQPDKPQPTKQKKCSNCNEMVDDAFNICPYCGFDFGLKFNFSKQANRRRKKVETQQRVETQQKSTQQKVETQQRATQQRSTQQRSTQQRATQQRATQQKVETQATKDLRQEEFNNDLYRVVNFSSMGEKPSILSLTLVITFYGLTVPYLFLGTGSFIGKIIVGIAVVIVTLIIWLFGLKGHGNGIARHEKEVRLLRLKYNDYEKSKSIIQELEKEISKRKRSKIITWAVSLLIAFYIVTYTYFYFYYR